MTSTFSDRRAERCWPLLPDFNPSGRSLGRSRQRSIVEHEGGGARRPTGQDPADDREHPSTARFSTADSYVSGGLDLSLALEPLTGNRYLFAGANPEAYFRRRPRPLRRRALAPCGALLREALRRHGPPDPGGASDRDAHAQGQASIRRPLRLDEVSATLELAEAARGQGHLQGGSPTTCAEAGTYAAGGLGTGSRPSGPRAMRRPTIDAGGAHRKEESDQRG